MEVTTYRVIDKAAPEKALVSCASFEEASSELAAQAKKDAKHGNKRVLEVIEHKRKAKRGRDYAKAAISWVAPEIIHRLPSGLDVAYLSHPDDLATLGAAMHHCSGTHFVWCCDVKIWQFFTLLDEKGTPHATLHTKDAEWLGKSHPLDEKPPAANPATASAFGYATFKDMLKACAVKGVEYKPGTHGPIYYASQTYEYGTRSHKAWGVVEPKGKTKLSFEEWCKSAAGSRYNTDYYSGAHRRIYYDSYCAQANPPEGIHPIEFQGKQIVFLSYTGRGDGYGGSKGDSKGYGETKEWFESQLVEDVVIDTTKAKGY